MEARLFLWRDFARAVEAKDDLVAAAVAGQGEGECDGRGDDQPDQRSAERDAEPVPDGEHDHNEAGQHEPGAAHVVLSFLMRHGVG